RQELHITLLGFLGTLDLIILKLFSLIFVVLEPFIEFDARGLIINIPSFEVQNWKCHFIEWDFNFKHEEDIIMVYFILYIQIHMSGIECLDYVIVFLPQFCLICEKNNIMSIIDEEDTPSIYDLINLIVVVEMMAVQIFFIEHNILHTLSNIIDYILLSLI
ncbi:hypothetical protein ACJX0J_034450, partial [Zea mays]